MPSPLVRVPSEIAPLVQQLCKQFRDGQTEAVTAGLQALLGNLSEPPSGRRRPAKARSGGAEEKLMQRLESLERRLATLESPALGAAPLTLPGAAEGNRFDLERLRHRPEEPGETLGEDALARRLGIPRQELRRLRDAGYRELVDGDRTATYLGRKGRGAAHLWSLVDTSGG